MNLDTLIGESADLEFSDPFAPPESFLVPMEFTTADSGHPCGYNSDHWLERGMARLTIRSNNDQHHYCLDCAKTLLVQGSEQLRTFLAGLRGLSRS